MDEAPRLPGYLQRYVTLRCGSILDLVEDPASLIQEKLEERSRYGLARLGHLIESLAYEESSTGDLIRRLQSLPIGSADGYVVSTLVNWAERMSDEEKDGVIAALSGLFDDAQREPKQRRIVDYAVQQLLWLFDTESAFAFAAQCVTSRRATRRHAAYRFYLRHGLDDRARTILLKLVDDTVHRSHREVQMYRRAVASDPNLVAQIGISTVLEAAESTYWRRRVIEGFLNTDPQTALALADEYPQEVVWAIRELRRTEFAPQVVRILLEHQHDPYLVNLFIECLVDLGDIDALRTGRRAAERLLALNVPRS